MNCPAMTNNFGYVSDSIPLRLKATPGHVGNLKKHYISDNIGNRLSTTNNSEATQYQANSLNQYTNIADGVTNSPIYDLDGNMLTNGEWTYQWNGENRLVKSETLDSVTNAGVPKVCVENEYDYMGRRFRKTVKDDYSGGAYTTTNVTTFIYNGWNLIAEASTAGHTNYYTYGLDVSGTLTGAGGCGGLLSKTTVTASDTNTYFYLYDGNANVVVMVEEAGTIVASYEYSPFGVAIKATGSQASSNAFRFSTHYFDAESGLYYDKERYYSSALGRFLSHDPLKETGWRSVHGYPAEQTIWTYSEPNEYSYVANDPIGRIDPYGLAGLPIDPSWPAQIFGDYVGDKIGSALRRLGLCRAVQIADAAGEDKVLITSIDIPSTISPNAEVIKVYVNFIVRFTTRRGGSIDPCESCWYQAWHEEYRVRRTSPLLRFWNRTYELYTEEVIDIVPPPSFGGYPICEAISREPSRRCRR